MNVDHTSHQVELKTQCEGFSSKQAEIFDLKKEIQEDFKASVIKIEKTYGRQSFPQKSESKKVAGQKRRESDPNSRSEKKAKKTSHPAVSNDVELARFARSGYSQRLAMEPGKIELIWDVIQNAPFNGYHRFGIRAPDTYFIRWNPDDEGVVAAAYTAAGYHCM
jgi:hypothetical protein